MFCNAGGFVYVIVLIPLGLLMLRTSSDEVWQKKRCREMQIAQPPKSVLGVTKVAIEKYIYRIDNFVERLFFL